MDFAIREAIKGDRDWVLECRNHHLIRATASSFKFISEDEHKEWWSNADRIKLIFEFSKHRAGFVTMARDPQMEDYHVWSFWLNPYTFRPPGTGRLMLNMVLYYIRLYHPHVLHIMGYVKSDNKASIKLHKNLGFIEQLSVDRDNYRLFKRKV